MGDVAKSAGDARGVHVRDETSRLHCHGGAFVQLAKLREDSGEIDQIESVIAGVGDGIAQRERGSGRVLGCRGVAEHERSVVLVPREVRCAVERKPKRIVSVRRLGVDASAPQRGMGVCGIAVLRVT